LLSFRTLFDDINGMIVDGIERDKCTMSDAMSAGRQVRAC